MKKLILIYVCCCFLLNTQAQNVELSLYFQDNVGNRDTVVFGLNDEATVGIDPELGEENIYGETIDNVDARVIHRDSSHYNCLRESMSQFPDAPNLYFPENRDLKRDIRPFGQFKSVNNNFEIFVRAMEYPVTIKADFTEIRGTFLEGYSTIYLLDENCDVYEDKPILYKPIGENLFLLPDNSYTTLVVRFAHEVGVEADQAGQPEWELYPNPASSSVSVSGLQTIPGTIEILSIDGHKLRICPVDSKATISLSLENFKAGIYLVRYTNHSNNETSVRKLILK